jgi:hypothetical protein
MSGQAPTSIRRLLAPVSVCLFATSCLVACTSGQQTVLVDDDYMETTTARNGLDVAPSSIPTQPTSDPSLAGSNGADSVVLARDDPVLAATDEVDVSTAAGSSTSVAGTTGLVIPADRLARLEADVVHYFATYRSATLSLADGDFDRLVALTAPKSEMEQEIKVEFADKRARKITATPRPDVTPSVQLGKVLPKTAEVVRVETCEIVDTRIASTAGAEDQTVMTVAEFDWRWHQGAWRIATRRAVATYNSDACADFMVPTSQARALDGEKG